MDDDQSSAAFDVAKADDSHLQGGDWVGQANRAGAAQQGDAGRETGVGVDVVYCGVLRHTASCM